MSDEEFYECIEQVQRVYDKKLSDIELEIWYENLKFMSVQRFNYILSEIYKTSKFMPKLADILQVHRQIPYTAKREEKQIKNHCEKCNDLGYVIYNKIIDGHSYKCSAVCDCGRQERYDGRKCTDEKNKSDYYIPTIQEIGLETKTTKPTDQELVKSMNMLKNSPIISENIKNIIRENFRKGRVSV